MSIGILFKNSQDEFIHASYVGFWSSLRLHKLSTMRVLLIRGIFPLGCARNLHILYVRSVGIMLYVAKLVTQVVPIGIGYKNFR